MHLTEISKEKTPEKFYSKFDEDTQTWIETELFPASDHVILRRKAAEGWQELSFFADHLELHHVLEDESRELIAEGQVYLEYLDWDTDSWSHYSFGDAAVSMLDSHTLQAVQSDGDVSLTIAAEWKIGSAKQTYVATYPGQKIRVGGVIKILNNDKLQMSYSDFLGFDMDTGLNTHIVIEEDAEIDGELYKFLKFESDGVDDEIEIDPYLSITEPTSFFQVSCDGYVLKLSDGYSSFSTTSVSIIEVEDTSSNNIGYISQAILDSTALDYFLTLVMGARTTSIIEETSTRIVLQSIGDFGYGSSHTISRTGDTSVIATYYIYPDRIFMTCKFTIEPSKSIVFTETASSAYTVDKYRFWGILAKATGSAKYESSGSETEPSDQQDPTFSDIAKYGVIETSDITMQIIHIDDNMGDITTATSSWVSQTPDQLRCSVGPGSYTCSQNNTYYCSACVVLDSADRENGSKLYTSTERLEMANQYQDTALTLTTGTAVTGLTDPLSIGSSGYASDGCFHVEMA